MMTLCVQDKQPDIRFISARLLPCKLSGFPLSYDDDDDDDDNDDDHDHDDDDDHHHHLPTGRKSSHYPWTTNASSPSLKASAITVQKLCRCPYFFQCLGNVTIFVTNML